MQGAGAAGRGRRAQRAHGPFASGRLQTDSSLDAGSTRSTPAVIRPWNVVISSKYEISIRCHCLPAGDASGDMIEDKIIGSFDGTTGFRH